jgi:hypothetical protein
MKTPSTPPAGQSLPVPLPPYPQRGDREGWSCWWNDYREAFRKAGASADGIFDESASPSYDSTDLANLPPPVFAERLRQLPTHEQHRLRESFRIPPAASKGELVRLLRGLEENPDEKVALADELREAAAGGVQ